MRNLKQLLAILLLLLLLNPAGAQKPENSLFTSKPTKGRYSLVAYLNGGAGYYFSSRGAPAFLNPKLTRVNPVYTARVMWHPDHQIKVGLESGLVRFYSYSLTDSAGKSGHIALEGIPILLVWSMSVTHHFNIFAGSGAYILNTKVDYGTKSTASKFSVGWMAAASYIWPVAKHSGLGAEFKWLYAAETSNGNLCLQLQYVWKFAQW
jgi:hypothetical protein